MARGSGHRWSPSFFRRPCGIRCRHGAHRQRRNREAQGQRAQPASGAAADRGRAGSRWGRRHAGLHAAHAAPSPARPFVTMGQLVRKRRDRDRPRYPARGRIGSGRRRGIGETEGRRARIRGASGRRGPIDRRPGFHRFRLERSATVRGRSGRAGDDRGRQPGTRSRGPRRRTDAYVDPEKRLRLGHLACAGWCRCLSTGGRTRLLIGVRSAQGRLATAVGLAWRSGESAPTTRQGSGNAVRAGGFGAVRAREQSADAPVLRSPVAGGIGLVEGARRMAIGSGANRAGLRTSGSRRG